MTWFAFAFESADHGFAITSSNSRPTSPTTRAASGTLRPARFGTAILLTCALTQVGTRSTNPNTAIQTWRKIKLRVNRSKVRRIALNLDGHIYPDAANF